MGTGIRLAARGMALLAAGPLLIAVGFRFGYPELTVLGATAVAVVPLAAGYVLWRPRLAAVRVAAPDRVTRGDPCHATLTVTNRGRLPVSVLAHDRCGPTEVPVPLLRLGPGQDTTVGYPVPTRLRGVVPLGPLRVVRRDPLGLVSATWTCGDDTRVWVHPRWHPLTAVPAGVFRSLDGRADRVPNGTIAFDRLREYVIGDDLRHVHWRTSARLGELMVREHLDTSLPRLVLLLDDRACAHPTSDAFEAACEAAASVILAAIREELPIALRLVSGAARGGDGRRLGLTTTSTDLLDLLAEATPTGSTPLAEVTARLRHQPAGDTLIFLTGPGGATTGARDADPATDLGTVAALRGAYPTILVGVLGTPDPPAAHHGLTVLAATTGEDFASSWDAAGVRA
jgi:uncharacterized protein (DUF58 family)